jgi:hypothetical protein
MTDGIDHDKIARAVEAYMTRRPGMEAEWREWLDGITPEAQRLFETLLEHRSRANGCHYDPPLPDPADRADPNSDARLARVFGSRYAMQLRFLEQAGRRFRWVGDHWSPIACARDRAMEAPQDP